MIADVAIAYALTYDERTSERPSAHHTVVDMANANPNELSNQNKYANTQKCTRMQNAETNTKKTEAIGDYFCCLFHSTKSNLWATAVDMARGHALVASPDDKALRR